MLVEHSGDRFQYYSEAFQPSLKVLTASSTDPRRQPM